MTEVTHIAADQDTEKKGPEPGTVLLPQWPSPRDDVSQLLFSKDSTASQYGATLWIARVKSGARKESPFTFTQ